MVKKILPDHSYKYESDNEILVEFSSDQVTKIRKRYGFKDSYDLDAALDKVAIFNEKPSYFNPSSGLPDQRDLLTAIRQYSANLEDALNRIGIDESTAIIRHCLDWDRSVLLKQLAETKDAAKAALDDLGKITARRGPPRKDAQRRLVSGLRKIYHEGTGEHRSFTLDPYSEEQVYEGPLVDFIEEISVILNVPLKNNFIGKALKEISKL